MRACAARARRRACRYEVFSQLVDIGGRGVDAEGVAHIDADHRIAREEWDAALGRVRHAGATWAPFEKIARASAADFDEIDKNRGGYIHFRELCEWVEEAEKRAGTPVGADLGVNEPLDSAHARGRTPSPGDAPPEGGFYEGSKAAAGTHVGRMRAGRKQQVLDQGPAWGPRGVRA